MAIAMAVSRRLTRRCPPHTDFVNQGHDLLIWDLDWIASHSNGLREHIRSVLERKDTGSGSGPVSTSFSAGFHRMRLRPIQVRRLFPFLSENGNDAPYLFPSAFSSVFPLSVSSCVRLPVSRPGIRPV